MAVCWSCSSAVSDGVRWCPICHANQIDPTAGRLASPGKRLGAFAIDTAIAGIFFTVFIVSAISAVAMSGGAEALEAVVNAPTDSAAAVAITTGSADAGLAIGVGVAAVAVIGYLILNLYFYAQGTTPGKKMLGQRVIKEDGSTAGLGTMILREWIGKFISSLISFLGFIWILIDTNRQGWHDKLVSTYVVE